MFLLEFLLLIAHPHFELANCAALGRQFDMGINSVDFGSGRVAHQCHADFLEDAGLHEPSVEGVAEIVEADVADTGFLQSGSPRALYDVDWLAVVFDYKALGFALLPEAVAEPFGERNLARFPFRCFGMRDRKDLLREVDIFPPLGGDLATAHTGVESDKEHGAEVARRHAEQGFLLGEAQDLAADPPLAHHFETGQWICSEKLLIDGPVQDVSKDA